MKLNLQLLCRIILFFFVLSCKKLHNMNKIEVTISHMSKTTTKWKRVILDKITKMNHQKRSLYEGEILVTSFNSELKRENGLFMTSYTFSQSHATRWSNSQ